MLDTEPTLGQRLRGAVWGQFVGDAYCLGCHWIYNLSELDRTFPEGISGFEIPAEGHYHEGKRSGDATHYGDAALLLLESVVEKKGVDVADFGSRFTERMAPPQYTGYVDGATRGTLENMLSFEEGEPGEPFDFQQGADDDQLATATSLAPVVVLHLHDEDLLDLVERVTRVRQNNDRAVGYMKAHALILRELLLGRDVHSALHRAEERIQHESAIGPEIRRKIQAGMALKPKPTPEATLELGQSCPLICSFPSAVHALVRHPESFEEATHAIATAGGDNAGRAALAGSWLGATLGVAAIPLEWRNGLSATDRIALCIQQLLD